MPRSQGTSRKGKPKKNERAAGMGRALSRAQQQKFRPKRNGSSRGAGMAMAPGISSIGLSDDVDKKMTSILEMNDLNDFLQQADMANREFVSDKEQFVVMDQVGTEVCPDSGTHVSWNDRLQPKNIFAFKELTVPRRPAWDDKTTPEELFKNENESFLEWRRAIAAHEEQLIKISNARVTPFEKNLEVWRQLWRVLERSSCILQIVDARNPLFYLSSDLRSYAVEELGKPMILLINKSDYLSSKQRKWWHEYFKKMGWDHFFFSAVEEQEKLDNIASEERKQDANCITNLFSKTNQKMVDANEKSDTVEITDVSKSEIRAEKRFIERDNIGIELPLSREELLDWLHMYASQHNCEPDPRFHNCVQYGMVGFPNVGKSSVINVLVGSSQNKHGIARVGVASQPGKTKHFQTLFLPDRDDMMLCDCPGLVFPSFVSSTADLIAAGVFPISQMRDHWPVMELICRRIPREILNAQYGIKIPVVKDLTDKEMVAPPTAEDMLTTYCLARSMLAAASGVPDYQRAARIIIKDYTCGKLLYCHSPPTVDAAEFERETLLTALFRTQKLKEKLGSAILEEQNKHSEGTKNSTDDDNESDFLDDIDLNDIDIIEIVQAAGISKEKADKGKRSGKHRSIKKWGKKGRKDRNKDPYGCHSTPDEMLDPSATTAGLIVKSGKYGKKGYTRLLNYAGTRAAAS